MHNGHVSRSITMPEYSWPVRAMGLAFLHGLVEDVSPAATIPEVSGDLTIWLIEHGLGPITHFRYGATSPALAAALQIDTAVSSAEIDLQHETARQMLRTLAAEQVDVVLLKGMALALTVYPQPALRTMSDVDVWVEPTVVGRAIASLRLAGFQQVNQPRNSAPYQLSRHGKIKFNRPGWYIGGIEIHNNPFAGTLLERAARINSSAVWTRKAPLMVDGETGYRLSAEDMILQVAAHLAVSNQFCMAALRGLLDIALTARRYAIDWAALADRAQRWRIAVPIWLSLHYADAIFGLPDVAPALAALQPSRMRRKLLARYVTLDRILAGYDFRTRQNRHSYLALLISPPFAS